MSLIEELSLEFGATPNELAKIIATAPRRYKSYPIPKRGGGERIIAQPAGELKTIQRFIVEQKLAKFPIHGIAAAYVQGKGISDNARVHASSNFILKLDFEAFFPSIRPRDLERANRRLMPSPLEKPDLEDYYRILFWGAGERDPKCLSIGAPSSPMISNIVMYALDCEIAEIAQRYDAVVTRYADDITVSANTGDQLLRFEKSFRRLLEATKSPKLRINEKKRGIYGRAERRMVTGLIVTPKGKISIGRERKRTISSLIHKFRLGHLNLDQVMHTKGLIGFAMSVEPSFVSAMRHKYGDQAINAILATES